MDRLMDLLKREASEFHGSIGDLAVTPSVTPVEIREYLERSYDFDDPVSPEELFTDVVEMLRKWTLHVTHPRYFGLFNPSVRPVTVVADALAALYNPQLAVWLHAPAANEIERHVLRFLLTRIGFELRSSRAGGSDRQLRSHDAVVPPFHRAQGLHGTR
jgi:glutamate/tyrosine decarboxylase-like PLP-dependent enzyme